MIQIGIDSFAAAYDDTSLAVEPSERLRNLVEQIEHADQVGLDARAGALGLPLMVAIIGGEAEALSALGRSLPRNG